jgi:hypothetical protein
LFHEKLPPRLFRVKIRFAASLQVRPILIEAEAPARGCGMPSVAAGDATTTLNKPPPR